MSDISQKMEQLYGEKTALQALLVGLCKSLAQSGLKPQVETAFAYADKAIEIGALKTGANAGVHHMQACLVTIEALRLAILDDPDGPRDRV